VQSYTRHQLKEDKFQEVTRGALAQAQAHRQQLTLLGIVVLVLVLAGGAYGYWRSHQDEQASAELGKALTTYATPIRAAGALPDPNFPTYGSTAERDTEAAKQFQAVADKFPRTDSGKNALYMAAAAALDGGQYAEAESKFKKVAETGNKDLAALAKLGLASVYEATNRDQDAINIYNELIKKPTQSVSAQRAQFALADLYEHKDPAQAKRIYDQLALDKSPTVAQLAKQRQSAVKQ
jgi:predicted negative regulator of RcsB-dependent stress response